ncbi:D-alanyl-D-alanine carboxypeptidase family protein [Zoogloea sp. LCSB751]|uniref:M15 family metallopeptidase n=1 Tax=Zoogloea sp. LCSB751 TaxID=1965277 RepID=UPI0009A53C26|nr:M15 family metallopeptidase [Zoogloea sp. LCSB751]
MALPLSNPQTQLPDLLHQLGIPAGEIARRGLRLFNEAQDLVVVETRATRGFLLQPRAAQAWREMQAAAAEDGIVLELVSAFRSIERQAELIRRKLDNGLALADILSVLAIPGTSEHHTGCAIDVTTPGGPPADESFEDTTAFAWLNAHAAQHGYTLSFPRGNPEGYLYEPWHWCFERERLLAGMA